MAGRQRSWWPVVAVVGLAGCGKSPPPEPVSQAEAAKPDPARFTQPFEQAVTFDAPRGAAIPPAKTAAGKPTAPFFEAVQKAWPTVSVTDAAGNPSPIAVAVTTDAGVIEIELRPDAAPNHVRNLLALARVGYYDGLLFERVVKHELASTDADGKQSRHAIEFVTAGCPAGDGEPDHSHLGYFLKPEPSDLKHEAGTVGFVRTASAEASACCRWYVTLAPAAALDGAFTPVGRVTAGLDVVKAIAARPVKDAAVYPDSEQPRDPVRIRSVVRK